MPCGIQYPQLRDAEWLQAQVDAGGNTITIAAAIGCSPPAVALALRQYGIQLPRRCSVCGGVFGHNDYRVHIRTCKPVAPPCVCPHCREWVGSTGYANHVLHCFGNPDVQVLTKRLLDDGGGSIVRRDVYNNRRVNTVALTHMALREHIGSWLDVAEYYGLLGGPAALEHAELKQIEVERQAVAMEQRILADEMNHGFDVCRVRELPSGGVAYMLR